MRMIRALVFKELREVFGIAVVALGLYVLLLIMQFSSDVISWVVFSEQVPFVDGNFSVFFFIISVAFTTALGFRQSAWEARDGTYLFLLHRPISRTTIFLTKLATGISVYLALALVPLVGYGCWAALPGHHASPFQWSMTAPTWNLYWLMPLLYLGAFLSGLRPARWFGTRLLPLAASGVLIWLLWSVPWLGWAIMAMVLAYTLLLMNICHVAQTRDYA
jgi:ABC-type transport system involved in multi-copper enzyme maturation permease subunit